MIRVGLFSEDRTMQTLLVSALGREFSAYFAPTVEAVEELIEASHCDVLIADLSSNSELLEERLRAIRYLMTLPSPVVVLADDGVRNAAQELVQEGAFGYCRRPPSIRDLKLLLMRAYERGPMRHAVEAPAVTAMAQQPKAPTAQSAQNPDACDRLIGSSPQMKRVYEMVRRVTNLSASVLINGPSGTGKELIARAIHNLGSRANKPFVAVSCGAIPETLIEAELFGHEKGAFTGSAGAREGYFEQAGEGTLFLDEIGDLSMMTQVKLLRVIQQMEFSRLGSTRIVPLKARLIFATHRDLSQLVAEGKFRQDLFYRINVMRIESPALQDHPEDIPAITAHFLRQYSNNFQKPMRGIEPDAMEMMENYSWPGNVRELENVMQRAIILAPGDMVRAEDLALHAEDEGEDELAEVVNIGDYSTNSSFENQLRDYKVRLAVNAVREHKGNKTLAARSLSISRAYLHRLLRLAEAEPSFGELRATVNM